MNNHLKKIGFLIRTIRALSWRQLFFRLIRIIKFQLIFPMWGSYLFPTPEWKEFSIQQSKEYFQRIPDKVIGKYLNEKGLDEQFILAEELCKGQIELINIPVQFEDTIDWNKIPEGDPLWNYHLHYFDWADPLIIRYIYTKESQYKERWIDYVENWIKHNPPGSGLGWHPYPTSKRIQNWLRSCAVLSRKSEEPIPIVIIQSILQQARFLSSNFEIDLQNNHLIANAAALAWVGTVFEDWKYSSKWQKTGYDTLWREVLRQVNKEGFHVERSPSYQLIVQNDVAETVFLADHNGISIPLQVINLLMQMESATNSILRPDGLFPLLHDTVHGYPDHQFASSKFLQSTQLSGSDATIMRIISQNQKESQIHRSSSTSLSFPETGFVIFRDGEGINANYLIFDCGSMGPIWNPGHGHASALSFELYAMGRPLIVDSGTYSYHQRPWRDYFRSTRAHNTLVVDGMDQSELWGSFRVGRIAKCQLLDWNFTEEMEYAIAEHEGYRRLDYPITHRREVYYKRSNQWSIIDKVVGTGRHLFELYFHFPAEANLYSQQATTIVVDYGEDWKLKIEADLPEGCKYHIAQEWISEVWYQKKSAPVLCYKWEGSPPEEWIFNFSIAKI